MPNSCSAGTVNHNSVSNASNLGLPPSSSTEAVTDESASLSRPKSSASDSSESSTESSTTSDDEDSEVTFNTIKRRQTKIHVIAPKPPPSSSPAKSDNSVASSIAETCEAGTDPSPNQCDETKFVNSNGDNDCKMKAVNDCYSGDVNDNNKENDDEVESNTEATKVNGDKEDIGRTHNAIKIASVKKGDEKSNKKEQKSPKSANSINTFVNSSDEQPNSLSGIVLPARFKKVNSKTKKSTIRKSDLRNIGSGSSDVDKSKVTK